MIKIAIQVAAVVLVPQVVLAADGPPRFDPTPSCRSAAAASVMTGRTTDNCITDENNARDLLKNSWSQYSASDKSHCDTLVRTGGSASYVELLSCLEMSRDARILARNNANPRPGSQNQTPDQTNGAGNSMRGLPMDRQPGPSGAPHRQPRPQ
jgi:hypothetical protein